MFRGVGRIRDNDYAIASGQPRGEELGRLHGDGAVLGHVEHHSSVGSSGAAGLSIFMRAVH